ncbi:ADP-ribosylglycohydrolase family protein [Caldanaerobius polysaccharolyticus]|uniref:ADP-ribosylglycohydrolase family protein n=1 Tax=Caldanaerobius polysaccharolyticus TaxID=44256 RepID=UPI00055435EF|nr:ADP-ribosylglycohydrolase family protein [Caldanaerobius polysaccharolyticus]
MGKIPKDYINRVYAGLLGKIIGVRHGAPIEGWTYEKIGKIYGEITDYLVNYKEFAADDDINGPLFFLRALEDYTYTSDITAEHIGLTWLNYVPYEHGFFWWGGYGKSTEHTAYLNLRSGIMAPLSGSIEQNGPAVAEQIGGQIFIDTWGLVIPDNPKLAAEYAEKAASVSHGGNGIYGGMFVAACISAAFTEKDIKKVIEKGLSVIPKDCEYARMARDVIKFYNEHPENWRECFKFIKTNYGYDRYPGTCHIIPNSAVMILSMLYGEGDFSKTINICNMCGWDTDCNVGNVGTIMGVLCGLEGIDYKKWRKPINDFLVCSSVIGSLNILDIPWCASYIANLAYKIAGEEPPEEWKDILEGRAAKFHFEFPGSTHGFRLAWESESNLEYDLVHTTQFSHSGKGALKVIAKPVAYGNELRVFHKTYYRPSDFHDSRYDPSFSPILYPGQRISASVMLPEDSDAQAFACLYVKDGNNEKFIESEKVELIANRWIELSFEIPHLEGACIEEAGVKFILKHGWNSTFVAYVDDFDFSGQPDYTIEFNKERMEVWHGLHKEVSQFTYLKGIWTLENGELSGSTNDFGEAYTGSYDWKDYSFEATVIPKVGKYHNINFRVQGAMRSYAVGLADNDKLVLYKNENGYRPLKEIPFKWEYNNEYTFRIEVKGANIKAMSKGKVLIEYDDKNNPYLRGQIGVSLLKGGHCHFKNFKIGKLDD